MRPAVRFRADYYRIMATHFRSLADVEPLASLRRHLRWLAVQHDEMAADLDMPQANEQDAPRTAPG